MKCSIEKCVIKLKQFQFPSDNFFAIIGIKVIFWFSKGRNKKITPVLSKKLVVCDSIDFDSKFFSQLIRSIEVRCETNKTSLVRILFKLKLNIVRSKLVREQFRFKSQINMYRSN